LSAKRAFLRKGKTQAGFWAPNGGGICCFFSERPFFQPFVRRRAYHFSCFCGFVFWRLRPPVPVLVFVPVAPAPTGCASRPAIAGERQLFRQAAALCEQRGEPINKLALQFSSQNRDFPTTLFSSTRSESVRRNVAWCEEPYDPALLAEVQRILGPVMNQQWDYDAGVDRLKSDSRPASSPIAAASP
jgi:hypothetical protein